jgi:transposase
MLVPQNHSEIPALTAQVAQAAFPKGNVVMKIRDTFGAIFEDEAFAALYPTLGQPAESPARLALVTLLQMMEGLTDRASSPMWRRLSGPPPMAVSRPRSRRI